MIGRLNMRQDHESREVEGEGSLQLGEVIRRRRLERGLTQEDLASRVGCTKGYLSGIETGRKLHPNGSLLDALESELGLTAGSLAAAAAWSGTPASVRATLSAGLSRGRTVASRRLAALFEAGGVGEDGRFSGALDEAVRRVAVADRTDQPRRSGAGRRGVGGGGGAPV